MHIKNQSNSQKKQTMNTESYTQFIVSHSMFQYHLKNLKNKREYRFKMMHKYKKYKKRLKENQ